MNTKAVSEYIVQWLKHYAESAKMRGFVVGVSGGIDSAVTSALCARTGMDVLCLEMPIHQPISHVERAKKHNHQLGSAFCNVRSQTVDLTGTFDTFCATLPAYQNKEAHDFSLVNARARLRMTTLYYFAGLHGYLVAGTGNKVEDFGVGFYTKYGDGGVDLSPIADLLKTEVYAVGAELGIISDIMDAPPTDGLWGDDRTDQDQIGATYPELEWAMAYAGSEANLSTRQRKVLSIYRDFHSRNRHKMEPIPVCKVPESVKSS